jgi:hypothetical protein
MKQSCEKPNLFVRCHGQNIRICCALYLDAGDSCLPASHEREGVEIDIGELGIPSDDFIGRKTKDSE